MGSALREALELIMSDSIILKEVVGVTLRMSLSSSLLALLIGVPLGVLLGSTRFKGKRMIIVINRTFMGLPPVVCGLLCYLLFSGVGPLGHLKLLYTVEGMVIAQVILITPIVIGMMESFTAGIAGAIRETASGLGLGKLRTMGLLINESRYQMISTYLLALSRAMAEVGAVSMVGGAIMFKTNVMTTAIMNFTNMGNFDTALALGIILFAISLVLNTVVSLMQGGLER